ncbi:nuclear pore complex protein [Thraustotheca clavata]|uniref:Nuclear pore complex protein n=1 Tax=Thraustotheca clavata TaxID=74557 RepID=A0A1W0A792_9STRA|nr:nuclear pore complex protein [Thraustotheca clavata]
MATAVVQDSEALGQSHKVLEQAFSADSKTPDLADQVANHSEPTAHNYFFEPYCTSGWTAQIAHKQKILPYPSVIASAYDNMRASSFSGLLQDIHHAWMSVDNTLFLWDYTRQERVTVFEGMEQIICAVGIATPIPGVFKSFVKHVLVVATASEMRLLVVLYENNDPVNGAIVLKATKLSISTDDCIVRNIVASTDGRIFFGGTDGQLHEFVYEAEEGMLHQLGWKRKCRKESHAQSFTQYLPSFFCTFSNASDSTGKVMDLKIDHERRILYMLQEPAHISIFDLGTQPGAELQLVAAKNIQSEAVRFCQRNNRNLTSCPEQRLFTNTTVSLTSLSIVAREESSSIHAIAVSSMGIRFYISAFSPGFLSSATKRPSQLELVHIRLAPPMVSLEDAPEYHNTEGLSPALLPGKSPLQVHTAFYRKGVFLAVNGGPDEYDQVVGLARDLTARHTQDANASMKVLMRESISCESCQGKVSDIQEFQPNSVSAPSSALNGNGKRPHSALSTPSLISDDPVVMLNELVTQVTQPVRHFLVLTNAGLHIFKKNRPIDQLFHILHAPKDVKKKLSHFVKCFGKAETCAMLFAIACGALSSDDALWTEPSSGSMKSDDHIVAIAMQAIFDFGGAPNVSTGGIPQTNSRFVMTDDMCMSYQHDGLMMFVSRILRPVWQASNYSGASIERVRNILFRLQQILETHYRAALASQTSLSDPSVATSITRQLIQEANPTLIRQDNAVRAEQASIRCLYLFVCRSIQVLSLLVLSPTPSQVALTELVTTGSGWNHLKSLIALLTQQANHSENLVVQLRQQCPLFFKDTDAAMCHGYQLLEAAKACATVEDRTICLEKSLEHFRLAAKAWKTPQHVQDLETICASYFTLGFLDGIVELSFATAKHFAAEDESRRICYGYLIQCVQFFVGKSDDNGIVCSAAPTEWMESTAKEACLKYFLDKLLTAPEAYFHSVLFTWLYANDQRNRLAELPTAHPKHLHNVEAFLKAKDDELLVKMYLVQNRYLDAAHVLWTRAIDDTTKRPITDRIELMSRAKSILAGANHPSSVSALQEVGETLDILGLQHQIWKLLNHLAVKNAAIEADIQTLSTTIIPVSPLYNEYAAKYKLWPECLRILGTCNSEDVATVELLWKRLLYTLIPTSVGNSIFNQWLTTTCEAIDIVPKTSEHLEHASWMSHVQAQIISLKDLWPSKAFPVNMLVHEVEHAWMWYMTTTGLSSSGHWIPNMFLDAGVPYATLFGVYLQLYGQPSASPWRIHLLRSLHALVVNWLSTIQGVAPRELQMEFATATPSLMSACDDIVVDLQGFLGDGNPTKAELIATFRRLKVDISTTKSTYA